MRAAGLALVFKIMRTSAVALIQLLFHLIVFFHLNLLGCTFPLSEGVCEIWLTSEDTGAYGRDIGTDLPTLLWRLVEEIPEGAMLRLGMTNPPYILEHLQVRSRFPSPPSQINRQTKK